MYLPSGVISVLSSITLYNYLFAVPAIKVGMEDLSVCPMSPAVKNNKYRCYQLDLSSPLSCTVIRNASFSKPNFKPNLFLNQIFNPNYLVIRNGNPN